jgi:hypothetical protein
VIVMNDTRSSEQQLVTWIASHSGDHRVVIGPVLPDGDGILSFLVVVQFDPRVADFDPVMIELPDDVGRGQAASMREAAVRSLLEVGSFEVHDCEDLPSTLVVCRKLWPNPTIDRVIAAFEHDHDTTLSVDDLISRDCAPAGQWLQ